MNKLTKAGLASTLAFLASITSAQAGEHTVIVDKDSHQKLFRIDEDWNIPGTSIIKRGMLDEAANVYCEWETSADIDANNNVSNIHEISRTCKEAEPADTAPFAGWPEVDSAKGLLAHYFLTATGPDTVIDGIKTGPNSAGVTSEMSRTWDFAAGTVCLHSKEGQHGNAPYLDNDMGCFPIPQNQHVDKIKAALAP